MRKWIALLLAFVLCLSLAACGEESSRADDDDYVKKTDKLVEKAELYEKYEELIDALEKKDYPDVINQIASLSHADKEASKEPGPEPVQLLCREWFVSAEDRPVQALSFQANGTCTVDGTAMTWTENTTEETWMNGYILHDGAVRYIFELNMPNEDRSLARVNLWTAEEGEYGINSDEHQGYFYDHEMIPVLADSWYQLTMFEDMPSSLSVSEGVVYFSDVEYFWAPAESSDSLLTANAYSRKGDVSTEYTLELKERDGYNVLYITNNDSGTQALYYTEKNSEKNYDTAWPEAIYATARNALNSYVNGYSIWVNDTYLSDNDAAAYIYSLFSQVEGYLDSADYLARFTVLPSLLTNINEINTDQLNQESSNTKYACWYTIDGKLDWAKGSSVYEQHGISTQNNYFTYDNSGRISEILSGWSRTDVSAIGTPVYDDAGRLLNLSVQTSSSAYTVSYTYDDQGRLIQTEFAPSNYDDYVYTYTYNEAGQLIQKVCLEDDGYYTTTEDYTYENGLLTEINLTFKSRYNDPYTTRTVFSFDDQCRPISAVVTTTNPNYTYKSTSLEYIYQDIYFLDTTGLVESN